MLYSTTKDFRILKIIVWGRVSLGLRNSVATPQGLYFILRRVTSNLYEADKTKSCPIRFIRKYASFFFITFRTEPFHFFYVLVFSSVHCCKLRNNILIWTMQSQSSQLLANFFCLHEKEFFFFFLLVKSFLSCFMSIKQ